MGGRDAAGRGSGMDRKLFLAILAMDSYNRGYGISFDVAAMSDDPTKIGNATLLDLGVPSGWELQSFFAQAYEMAGGVEGLSGTVVSFRGTDNPNPLSAGSDFWQGWTVGAGFAVGQAKLAIDF